MPRRIPIALVAVLVLAESELSARQLRTAPVQITHAPSMEINQGDEATSTIMFQADRDLDRLDVSINETDGVEVRSERRDAVYENLKAGETRAFTVMVRLIAPERSYLAVHATTTVDGRTAMKTVTFLVGRPKPPAARRELALEEDLASLTLLNLAGKTAVIRFGKKPFQLMSIGDRVGRNKAEVKAIEAGRIVLEETFIGADGKPNRAEIVIKKGETGGTRVLLQPEKHD